MAQYAANEIENLPDSPVAREDLGAGGIPRGAGARSPLFWKVLLLSVAVIWGYSFTTMKDALGTIPVFALLYVRFLPAALVMFAVFHKRIIAHLNARNLIVGLSMGVLMWAAYALQTVGLAHTTAGKNAFDGHVLHPCTVRELFPERRKAHALQLGCRAAVPSGHWPRRTR
ncbi:MAG: EamA family transporter [Collinsella sp.]